jgi:peptide/nickel transport system permease protein
VMISWLPDLEPFRQDLANRLQPPWGWGGTRNHLAGTDSLGRDLVARVAIGTRLSLTIGLIVATISAVIGVSLGLAAGIHGGVIDDLVTACSEIVLAIPTIVVGLVVVATVGQGLVNLIALLVLSAWITQARVLRLHSRRVMDSEYVLAARSLGSGRLQLLRRHVLPNVAPQIVVVFCQQVAAIMIWESSLTYLGIGLPIERVSLGGLIRDGQQHLFDAPWLGIVPGVVLATAVVAFSLLAGWLQEWMVPGRRRSSSRNRSP